MKRVLIHRLLLLLLAVLFSTKILAASTYYYYASATSNNTGLGKVFLSGTQVTPTDEQYANTSTLGSKENPLSDNNDTPTVYGYTKAVSDDVNLYAQWKKGSTVLATSQIGEEVTLKLAASSQTKNSPTANNLTVYFMKVVAVSNDDNHGTATVTTPNKIGTSITLTATPKDQSVFLGWKKNDENGYFSTSASWSSTVTEMAKYTAYFREVVKTEDKNKGTVAIINRGTDQTITIKANAFPLSGYIFKGWSLNGSEELITDNPYTISMIGDNDVYIARFEEHEILPYFRVKNTYYNNYMSMIDNKSKGQIASNGLDLHAVIFVDSYEDVVSDPGSIFYITKGPDNNEYDLDAQGASLHEMQNQYIGLNPYVTNNLPAYKTEVASAGIVAGVLQEQPKGYFDAGTGDGGTVFWGYYIIPVDKNTDNYFGVNAKLEFGSKYYTTLYAAFPFKLPEDKSIRAYYIKEVNNGVATCTEISDVVPEETAVFLECNNSSPSDNRLELVDPSDSRIKKIEGNMMKGTYFNCAGKYYNNNISDQTYPYYSCVDYENRVANDRDKMRVLSKNSNGEIGFFRLKSNVEYMAANKAWLEIPSGENAKSFSIVFEDGAATGISEIRTLDSEDVSGSYYYDLQGRRVENPSHGLYIHNGKKIYIK